MSETVDARRLSDTRHSLQTTRRRSEGEGELSRGRRKVDGASSSTSSSFSFYPKRSVELTEMMI